MARARKIHEQLPLDLKRDKNGQRRGGARKGAGRPKNPDRARPSERHKTRESFRPYQAVHVTLRAAPDIDQLRGFSLYQAIREALVTTYARALIRVIHISIQNTHLHLIVETNSRLDLARGMQGFEIACAKNINAAMTKLTGKRRRGTVFPDRYHAVILRSPRQARGALAYVLNNWRRHGESTLVVASGWRIDPFSTAPSFDGFKDFDARAVVWPETYRPLPTWKPRTWLLSTGWKKHGLIGVTEVPGPAWKPREATDGKRRMRTQRESHELRA